ncbi:MAG: tol-pal system protein YbgF [Blastochloris viridis]|uniref:Cell division coordinator CpoB n=1 Tax=Blastochloris viridis TaxID=1079 RepID=A0A6N4RBM5_BLAVI|nr:MAG: tol-pal system protein YbgF [Blastochloris viridis]
MSRLSSLLMVTVSMLAITANSWGQAVSVDAESLVQRLDAIEKRISAAESRRSSSSSTGQPNLGGLSSYTAADIEQRMSTLEDETSQLRGNTDRSLMAIERLAKRFDDYIKDLDMRLADIETRMETLSSQPQASAAAATPVAATTSTETDSGEVVAETKPAAKPAAKATIPADMSAADHYNKAYAYLTATDYKNAQVWFEEFLKRHPKDALADNAYYWLGEVYLVQNDPKTAATKFRDGLKAFPKGGKAPANLFKMGVALEQLKQPKLAKAAWEKLTKDYPQAPEASRAKDKLLTLKVE